MYYSKAENIRLRAINKENNMKLKKIILLTAMVALPSVGFSEDQKKATAYSIYQLDSQPGHALCELPKSEKDFDPGFTYLEFISYDAEKKKVNRYVYHPSLIKILQKHDNIDITHCVKNSVWDSKYQSDMKTNCELFHDSSTSFSAVTEIVNNNKKNLEVSCGKVITTKQENNYDHCFVPSKTPYKDNQNLQKIFTRDECLDVKILNPKSE
jgi:hypothetical protein